MSHLRSLQDRARTRVGLVLKDKWQLEALLGVGGTAAIYAARHRNGKRAAIKILHPELGSNDEVLQRFVREGYAANKLEHPGAVSVLDDDRTDDGAVFLVMELLDGVALDRYARQEGERLPLDQTLRVGDELLDVLAAAHAKGVIHRDIKPANVFLTRDGRVKVLDFGIARLREGLATDSTATQTGTTIGTPAFMPPEQARGRWNEVDARTDIWAVGATLFALVCGQRPRKADTVNEELLLAMTQPVPSLATMAPNAPRALVEVIDRALAFDRERRWPDARAMQVALRRAGDSMRASPLATSHFVPGSQSPTSSPLAMTFSPDTAPVLHGATPAVQLDPLDARLTTSRPLITGGTVPPATRGSNVGVAIGVFAATLVVGLAAAGGFVFLKQRNAAPSPPAQVVTTDPKPIAAPPPPPIETAATPATTTTTSIASAQPAATTATVKPQTTTKPNTTHGAKPAQPASDQSMMNERF